MDEISVIARLRRFEGCVPYMYCCTGGEVTIGIGHAIHSAPDAAKLSWAIGGAPAGAGQVQADFLRVAAAPKGEVASAYAGLTQCRMSDEDIQKVAEADVRAFEAQLVLALPQWSSFRRQRRRPCSTWPSISASAA